MVKCSSCGSEIPVTWSVCPFCGGGSNLNPLAKEEKRGHPSIASLERDLEYMQIGVKDRDFFKVLTAAMEALVEVGRLYEWKGIRGYESLYNGIATATISAHKGDWVYVESYINGVVRDLKNF